MTETEFEKGLMKRAEHAAYVGLLAGGISLACILFLSVFLWLWPNAIYTMSAWVSIPMLLVGMMSTVMMPVAGVYVLICMVGLTWLDHREAKRERDGWKDIPITGRSWAENSEYAAEARAQARAQTEPDDTVSTKSP